MAKVTIQQFNKKAKERGRELVRRMAQNSFSEIILMSPVDTGRFRGNWLAGIGTYPVGTTEEVDPSGQATIEKASAVVATFEVGQNIHLVNNLPYAHRLEYGWSSKAPGGMVRLTAKKWQAFADKELAEMGD